MDKQEKRSCLNDLDPSLEKRTAAEDRPYRVVGSWNVNLIYTLQPGTPLTVLLAGNVPHGSKPHHQWLVCILKNRTSRGRCLTTAIAALV